MKTTTKKQRHTIYKKTLANLLKRESLGFGFLCWELALSISKKVNTSDERNNAIKDLEEFWLFKPKEFEFAEPVWFSSHYFSCPTEDAELMRLFVMQMLIEMTK